MITKDLGAERETSKALNSPAAVRMLRQVTIERVREEVEKMVAHDTLKALQTFRCMNVLLLESIFRDGLRLSATLKHTPTRIPISTLEEPAWEPTEGSSRDALQERIEIANMEIDWECQ
jgi:hypothetical protein